MFVGQIDHIEVWKLEKWENYQKLHEDSYEEDVENDEKDLLEFLDKLHSNNIKFGLSNVLRNKGKENTILINWLSKNQEKYKVCSLEYDYKNSNYQTKNKDSITEEVLIINY